MRVSLQMPFLLSTTDNAKQRRRPGNRITVQPSLHNLLVIHRSADPSGWRHCCNAVTSQSPPFCSTASTSVFPSAPCPGSCTGQESGRTHLLIGMGNHPASLITFTTGLTSFV
uniref:Uncharacterized protein n=1 Tax=Spongospora subterranea TaxID=70186 RepID=A0A0H5RWF2_9EUKA|eukprot:CRZ13079.1 hypothetical protein [Spongospora subterranea]